MTREQAIKHLEVIKGDCALVGDIRAIDIAISALSTEGEYIKKADMERILYSTNNAVRIGELFTELPTYSFPDSAKTDTAKPESDLISRTQAINDYAQCFADEYGMDCGEMFVGVLHQCPTFPDSAFKFCNHCGADMRGET